MRKKRREKIGFAARFGLALGFVALMASCSFHPAVMGVVREPLDVVPPSSQILYESPLVVNDVGDGLHLDTGDYWDFSSYGDFVVLDISTIYYDITTFYNFRAFDVAADLVVSQYSNVTDLINNSVAGNWTLAIKRNTTARSISFYGFNLTANNFTVEDFTDISTATASGSGYITYSGTTYYYYSVYFPRGDVPTSVWLSWVYGFISKPFVEFMSGYTTGKVAMSEYQYTQAQYTAYGESEYQRGKRDGEATIVGDGYGFVDLAGALVNVPIYVLSGLSVFSVFNTPLVSIIVTFLFIAVALFIIKKVLAR